MSNNSFTSLANKIISNTNTTPLKKLFNSRDINFRVFHNDLDNAGWLKIIDPDYLQINYDNLLLRLNYTDFGLYDSFGLNLETFNYKEECKIVIDKLNECKDDYHKIVDSIENDFSFINKLFLINYINLYYLVYNLYKYNFVCDEFTEKNLINDHNSLMIKFVKNIDENYYFIVKNLTRDFIDTFESKILSVDEYVNRYKKNEIFYDKILSDLIKITNVNVYSSEDIDKSNNALLILNLLLQTAFYNKYNLQLEYYDVESLKVKFNECLLKISDVFNKYIKNGNITINFEKLTYSENYTIKDNDIEFYIINYDFSLNKLSLRIQKMYKLIDISLRDPFFKAFIKSEEINNFKSDIEIEISKII